MLDYIEDAQSKGFSDDAIKEALRIAGWHKKDISQAFPQETTSNSQTISPPIIFISILLFLFLGLGSAYGVFWYQSHPQSTISPTPKPTESLSPGTHATPTPTDTTLNDETQTASVSTELSYAHNALGFSIIKELQKTEEDKNIVLSPTSIALALSMTYNGASDSTKLAMAKTMKIIGLDVKKLNTDSAELIKLLANPDPRVTLTIANSIWARKGITFLPEFLSINKTYYNAQIQSLDFSVPSAADTINGWVSKNTKGKIPTIVEKPIDASIVMYLINAVYFYGSWTNEFDATLTKMRDFTLLANTKIQHLFMEQHRTDFLYQETSAFQAILLPYGKNKQLSMVILLPKTSLTSFLGQLTHATWNSWMKSFSEMEGTLFLPKFKTEFKTSLKKSLSTLGMTTAFSDTADFSNMRKQKDLLISDVIHKTFIEVSEKGTEAAAATSVGMAFTSFSEPKPTFVMEVNKPFFFAIIDTSSSEILFMGIIKNPTK